MHHNTPNQSPEAQSRSRDDVPSANQPRRATVAPNTTGESWVLITGASSGFGEEFARQYAEQGYALVLVARRLDRLQALAETLREEHRVEVVVEQVDLSDVATIVRLQERLRERGIAIDILINNAGHGLQGPFLDSHT